MRVTVPVEELPPVTLVGLKVKLDSTPGLMASVAVWVPPKLPVMIAEVKVLTAVVVTGKVVVVAPAATVTLAGTVAMVLSLDSVTTAPPAGAGLLKVTVPVEELPPVTLVGLKVRFESTGGLMVSVAVCVP